MDGLTAATFAAADLPILFLLLSLVPSSRKRRADNGIRDLDTGRRVVPRDRRQQRPRQNANRRRERERASFPPSSAPSVAPFDLFLSSDLSQRERSGTARRNVTETERRSPRLGGVVAPARRDRCRRVAGRVAGWDRTRWLVARQPDFPSRSLARARPPPFPLSFLPSFALLFSLSPAVSRRVENPRCCPPARALRSPVLLPPLADPPAARTHRRHRFLPRFSPACRRIRAANPRRMLHQREPTDAHSLGRCPSSSSVSPHFDPLAEKDNARQTISTTWLVRGTAREFLSVCRWFREPTVASRRREITRSSQTVSFPRSFPHSGIGPLRDAINICRAVIKQIRYTAIAMYTLIAPHTSASRGLSALSLSLSLNSLTRPNNRR